MCAYDSNNHPVYAIAGLEIAQNICKIMQPAINANYQYSIPNVFVGKNCERAPIDCSSDEDLAALQFIWDEETYLGCERGECPEYERDPLGEYCGPDSVYCPVGCADGGSRACNTGCNGAAFWSYSGNGELMSLAHATTRCPSTENGTTCYRGSYSNYCHLGCQSEGNDECVYGCTNGVCYTPAGTINVPWTGNTLPDGVTMYYGDLYGCYNGVCYKGSEGSFNVPWTGPLPDGVTMSYGDLYGCYNGVCYLGSNGTTSVPWTGPLPDGVTMNSYGFLAGCYNGICYFDGSQISVPWTGTTPPDGLTMNRYGEIYGCYNGVCYLGSDGTINVPWTGTTPPDGVTMNGYGEIYGCYDHVCYGANGSTSVPWTGPLPNGMTMNSYGDIFGCDGNDAWHGSYSESCSNGCTTCSSNGCKAWYAHCK